MAQDSLVISKAAHAIVMRAEQELHEVFHGIDSIEIINQNRVLAAFQAENVAQRHFAPTTGYGYADIGRDALERVFARVFATEEAIVRPQIVNGTHALFLALAGLLSPGDTMLSITGKPYDTLEQAIGIKDCLPGSLCAFGIQYKELPLHENGNINTPAILDCLQKEKSIRVVYVQRSRGYAWREAFTCEALQAVFSAIRAQYKDCIIVVDNCYGEFTEEAEPSMVGADVVVGSLIKNPGGGLAPTGGYIAGTAACIERIEQRLTVPGIGREVGSYAGGYLPFYQGLFLAPHTTAQSLKTAVLFARIFENAGMKTLPRSDRKRADIIQALQFQTEAELIAFVQSIQRAAPVDSFVVPEPWDMPGYTSKVIMAAGTFIEGASIELSADAPIREPYIAYIQGALTYAHGKLAAMLAWDALQNSAIV